MTQILPDPQTGAASPKRRRRTSDALAQLDAQIVEVLADDNPQTVRHIFYRMTDPRLPEPVGKTEQGYKQIVARCVALRRNGRVPYAWISDSTRSGVHVSTWADPGSVLHDAAWSYRTDPWSDVASHVEVWCESRSIAGVVTRLCDELAVSLYAAGGFSSLSLPYEAAERIKAKGYAHFEDPVHVLYIGDFDPAGMLIPDSIEEELKGHLNHEVLFDRIAITEEQIAEHDLPTKPRKAGELRRQDIKETVEAEAMPAAVLRDLLREAVLQHLPEGALEATDDHDRVERAALMDLADAVSRHGASGILEKLNGGAS